MTVIRRRKRAPSVAALERLQRMLNRKAELDAMREAQLAYIERHGLDEKQMLLWP